MDTDAEGEEETKEEAKGEKNNMINAEKLAPILCCYLGCDKEAKWVVCDEDIPIDSSCTYACSEHVAAMLSERNYVVRLGSSVEPMAS